MIDNPILTKTFAFALRVIKLNRYLAEERKEFTLSREILVAGTNIGKHVKEAQSGETPISFKTSMARALQKADETEYWLQLIHFAELLNEREYASIETDRKEIAKILTKIVKTTKENVGN